MKQSSICYFNGDLVPFRDLQLHVSDLLFQRGYGVFDFFRSREGRIPWLEDYVERLYNSLELSAIETDLDRVQFTSLIHELQQKNGLANGAFKVIVSGGYSDNLESAIGQANLVILNIPWNRPPEESYEKGVNLISEEFVRPNPDVKTLYYFNTLRLHKKLREYNAVDVMFYTNCISEASRANLFFIKGDRVYTPASDILKGITRKKVLSLFPEIRVEDIDPEHLYDFDELFMTSTTRDITPVVAVDGKKIGTGTPGPLTRKIQVAFQAKGW
jgi:branched-subunit amino acid aminotransferase/4-amino-4-deoxychorismate lyase